MTRVTRGAWVAYVGIAGIVALVGLVAWLRAIGLDGPVLYGEGAVGHAALLSRSVASSADTGGPTFPAPDYPPPYFLPAAVGHPFATRPVLHLTPPIAVPRLTPSPAPSA